MFTGDYKENAESEVEPANGVPEEIKAFLETLLLGDQRVPVERKFPI